MKRKIFILLILSINLVGFAQKTPSNVISILQSGNSITLTFNLPTYTIKDTSLYEPYGIAEIFKYIDIDYFGSIDDIGYPQLPQLTVDLSVLYGSSDFQVTSSNVVTQDVTVNRKILPTQEDFEENPNFQMDSSYYNSTGSLYDFTFQLSDPFIVFDENGISFSIFPFTYNPQLNRITILTQATFTISYSISELKSDQSVYSSPVRESYLSSFFENYISQKSYSDFAGRYLIITAPDYESTLANFANYKRNIGFEVNVVNTNTTGSSANNITSYIQAQYNNTATRPDFVLLVGDHADIPASGGNPSGEEKNDPITDLNYARLAGDDYFADVFLGRFSVSSPDDLQNIINKTTYMEMNIHQFEKKAKFLAGSHEGWNSGWMEKQFEKGHNYVIKNTFNPQGFNSQKLYQPSTSAAVNAINDNPLYYIYSGHGWFTHIAGVSFTLSYSSLTIATNSVFPFGFSFACKTGNYAYSETCFGEHWIRAQRGGVAYFGSSVNTMVNSDKAIEKKIFGDAFIDKDHIAAITNLGMKRYWQRFWSWTNRTRTKRYMKAYNLLGDPSLNKNGVKVLTVPVVCGSTTIWLRNPTYIPVTWSVTGDYSLSNQTDTSVVITRTGFSSGRITAELEGLGYVTENLMAYDLSISGPDIVCSTPVTFTLNNLPAGCSVTWSHSGNLSYISGQNTTGYTVKANSILQNLPDSVKATVSGPCGEVVLTHPVSLTTPKGSISHPLVNGQYYVSCMGPNDIATVSVTSHPGVTSHFWVLYNETENFMYLGRDQTTIPFSISGNSPQRVLELTEQIPGCPSVTSRKVIPFCEPFNKLTVSPNPSSSLITISEEEQRGNQHETPWELRLLNQQGVTVLHISIGLPYTTNVSGLQHGLYILHARQGQHVEQHRVLVE